MTCILGMVKDNQVFIGGDSAGVSNYDIRIRADEKVWEEDGWIYGFTSSFRMGQLLRYSFNPPEVPNDNLFKYMVTDWIDALRECLFEGGFAEKANEVETGGCFLVGYKNRLFRINNDFQVAENKLGCAAVGNGKKYAVGASLAIDKDDAEEVITESLSITDRLCSAVSKPFKVVHT